MPDSLKHFSDKTQESIVQWFNTVKTNCSVSEIDEIDDYYLNPILLIVDNLSKSIFCILDVSTAENQQITEDLIAHLRQTYYQANQTSLRRVFDIKATVKG
ncbi:9720_t:CDS:2 [Racocetra fulgida]|uniref:9720_t:CDS:1 n=1 Tax=Racocetra fulgida TaxID=60492 RepID=A0A9N9CCB5_9GLOM|nr:9720_t:CDS:2 [Racocetra fulgida]